MMLRQMAFLFACLATLCVAKTAYADDVDRVRQLRSTDSILPLSKILIEVERRYPGTLLDVELEDEKNLIIYEIEILGADHIVRQINVNARNGEILKAEQD